MKKKAGPSTEYRPLADFRYEIRRFLNFSECAAREAGVEPHQHQALLAIKGLPAERKATVGTLAERLQVHHHSAVELADRLQEKGLIRRVRDESDHREVLLDLTRRGESLLQRLSGPHRAELLMAGPKLILALRAVITGSDRRGSTRMRTKARSKRKEHARGR
ncbi:MAG TPA: MarR family transcriptional regulator [Candidatus Acidoferrum sp.]|nr:MarR family transcriptional regulator [Candidatus Acidoferrum sp.]